MNIFIYIKHFIKGLHYGYPLCCIHQFCNEMADGIMVAQKRCDEMGWDITSIIIKQRKLGVEYVPCSKCAKIIDKLIKKEILNAK